jgi:hypothetical protein
MTKYYYIPTKREILIDKIKEFFKKLWKKKGEKKE